MIFDALTIAGILSAVVTGVFCFALGCSNDSSRPGCFDRRKAGLGE